MAKEKRRRPKRIAHPKQPDIIDDDLRELASVLDEHQLDQNVEGWFTIPWRDGWNAVGLALGCFRRNLDEYESGREKEIATWLQRAYEKRGIPTEHQEDYWQAGEFLQATHTEGVSLHLFAGLRCLQVLLANSSGGGTVYNYILKVAFDKTEPSHLLEDAVLEYRCRDAIGVGAALTGSPDDRKRRAFSIAWKRGLFHAAYSIGPIKG